MAIYDYNGSGIYLARLTLPSNVPFVIQMRGCLILNTWGRALDGDNLQVSVILMN